MRLSLGLLLIGASLALAAPSLAQETDADKTEFLEFMGRKPEAEVTRIAAEADAKGIPLGARDNPVRVYDPAGEHAYLKRLRCSDGSRPMYGRDGSVGAGPFGSILDLYIVVCKSGTPLDAAIYMDMYHPKHVETRAVPGFTLAPR